MATFAGILSDEESRPRARDMVSRGFLPETVPPVFTSANILSVLDAGQTSRYLVSRTRRGKLARFNASKRGQQRRVFAVPHPLFHHDASLFFEKNWDAVAAVLSGSKGSESKPSFPLIGFRAVEITPQGKLPTLRLQALARKRYCLITDVSRCFPSIYTHAIPWALDGKEAAKLDRHENSSTVRGNRLDFAVRQAQDGQTAGIPVGPDTSRLISELILSRIDKDYVQAPSKRTYYLRHVDDYWIGGDSIDECEAHLHRLRLGLAEYQLDINEAKTRILPLAQAIGETWPTELKREISDTFIRYASPRSEDVTALLARIIGRAVASQDDGIIKYAIRQIDRARVWNKRWAIFEPFLAHAAVQFPHSFDYVARVIAWRARLGEALDTRLWKDVTRTVATSAASLGHDSELVWALWLMKELGIKVTAREVDKFTKTSGPLVLGFLAHIAVHGLAGGTSLLNELQDRAVGDEQFTGEMWPLSLELYHLGHHAILDAHHTPGAELTAAWHAAGASLIDWNNLPRVFDRDDGEPPEDWEPEFAIEDYASAYDGDDEDDEESASEADDFLGW